MQDEYQWGPQQLAAIEKVRSWLKDPAGAQVFKLFGWAGTGKTTLARHLAKSVEKPVVYAAFTGKAALVMRSNGCYNASTIHSLIYSPKINPITNDVEWELNSKSDAASAGLIVIDEVSMVNRALAEDLLSFNTRVLVLGDPAQLPAIGEEGFFVSGDPDIMLTEIHRQALGNPIIQLSKKVREGQRLYPGKWGKCEIMDSKKLGTRQLESILLSADQVICGSNKSRQSLNAKIRDARGLVGKESWHPVVGDQLVCLKNRHQDQLLNGSLWAVVEVREINKKHVKMLLLSLDGYDFEQEVKVPVEFFKGTEHTLDPVARRSMTEFTWGWALTCHKSQGSQWGRVVIVDEGWMFKENKHRWQYTAITRAVDSAVILI